MITCDLHKVLDVGAQENTPNSWYVEAIFNLLSLGFVFYVLSFIGRNSDEKRARATEFVRTLNRLLRARRPALPEVPLHFADHPLGTRGKAQRARELKSDLHIDDRVDILAECEQEGIETVHITRKLDFYHAAGEIARKQKPFKD